MAEIIQCKRCGNELGRTVTVDKIELFEFGGLILREARGRCKNCGEPFYYSVSDRALEQLLKSMVKEKVRDSDYLLALESAKEMAVQHGKTTYIFDGPNITITNSVIDDKENWIALCSPDGSVILTGKFMKIKERGR